MNAVLENIAARHSCRSYTAEPVSRADLETIVKAGVQAPSSRGNAPWYVAVVTDQELIDDLSRTALEVLVRREARQKEKFERLGTSLFYDAPAVILVATRPSHDFTSSQLDAGLLVENMVLAATSLGLGSCVCGFATQAFRDLKAGDGERLSKRLGFPWGYAMTVGVIVGHPAAPGQQHPTDLSKVRFFEA